MSRRTGEPRLASAASWLVLAASFGLSAATWIALARLAGFDGAALNLVPLAWLMPAAVDGYIVVALVLWLSPVPAKVARFARTNTYAAASVGVAAQSAYHCLIIWDRTGTEWRAVLAAVVGAIPPAVAALAVHMRALVRRESRQPQLDRRADAPMPVPPVLEPPEVPVELPRRTPPTVQVSAAERPAEVPPEVPPPTGSEHAVKNGKVRRPADETRRFARALQAGDPGLTNQQIADLLGVTQRRLRDVLAATATIEGER